MRKDDVVNWSLFWTAFGAIGATLGAFATATAVIVSLWQVRHQESKKLRLRFSDSMKMFSVDPNIPEETLICLSITNVGNRKLIVQNWGFFFHKKNCHGLLGINQSQLTQGINPSLPYELEIEHKIDLYLEHKYFIRNLKECVAEKDLNPRRKLIFFVSDSAGKIYRLKSKKTVAEMIKK